MKKPINLTAFALAALIFGASTSCQKADNKNSAANQPDNKAVANANTTANTATPAAANTSTNSSGSPTDAYKAAYAARKNKDVAALKKLMSKDILEFFAVIGDMGDGKKQTLDQILMELCEKPQAATAEARNEKIDGDKATIEYLDEKGEWQPMEFVKEDGAWKLTIEKPEKDSPDDKKNKK